MTELFDSHCHLTDERLAARLPSVLANARAAGVTRVLTIGVSQESSRAAVALAEAHEGVHASVGVHCEYADAFSEPDLVWLASLAKIKKVVAIGEFGLDYYWPEPPRDAQIHAFTLQLKLAAKLEMPAILHVRDAHEDVLSILAEHRSRMPQLVLHCFGGSARDAKAYLALGAYISFAGNVTYKKADALREAAAAVPLDRILVETDAPYLSPEPNRGRTNEPANVKLTAEFLARLLHVDADEFARVTTENAKRVFRIND